MFVHQQVRELQLHWRPQEIKNGLNLGFPHLDGTSLDQQEDEWDPRSGRDAAGRRRRPGSVCLVTRTPSSASCSSPDSQSGVAVGQSSRVWVTGFYKMTQTKTETLDWKDLDLRQCSSVGSRPVTVETLRNTSKKRFNAKSIKQAGRRKSTMDMMNDPSTKTKSFWHIFYTG